jgi:hypothetical protein
MFPHRKGNPRTTFYLLKTHPTGLPHAAHSAHATAQGTYLLTLTSLGYCTVMQDYVCKLPLRVRRLADRAAARKLKAAEKAGLSTTNISWIFNRQVSLL